MKFKNKYFSPLKRGPIHGRFLAALLVTLILLATFSCQQFAGQKTGLAPASGAELFKSKCNKCHEIELAMKKYRSAGLCFATITRMKEKQNADISEEEADLMVKFHVDRQKQEAVIFKEKCQKCHPGKVFLEK